MIDQVFIIAGILSSFHALTFARWLKQNDNTPGAYILFIIAMLGIVLPIYRTYWHQ